MSTETIDTIEAYKISELGTIPQNWNVTPLNKIGEFTKGKGVSKKELVENGNLPCIRYAEIYTKYDFYTYAFDSRIDEESASASKEISEGDLLFAGSGETLEDIGKSIAYLGKEKAFAGGDIIIFKQRTEDSQYLGHLLNHEIVRRQLHKLGQGHSVVHVYPKSLQKIKILLPPLPEQQKIAQILGTWDKAIAKQKTLIAQKQQLKKGLMHQLLSGKKRFEGFEDKWINTKLGRITTIKAGGTPSKAQPEYWGGNIRWMNSGELNLKKVSEVEGRINELGLKNSSTSLLPKYCVLIGLAGQGKTRGTTAINLVELCTNQSVAAIFPSDKFDSFFMYFLLDSKYELLRQLSAGDGGRGGLNLKILNSIKVSIPGIDEQQKISEVLTAADNEIAALQQQLQKLKTQKQGLMRQLLSGQIRVKIKEA